VSASLPFQPRRSPFFIRTGKADCTALTVRQTTLRDKSFFESPRHSLDLEVPRPASEAGGGRFLFVARDDPVEIPMSTTPNNGDIANLWFSAYLAAMTRAASSFYAAPRHLDQSILPWTFAGIVVNETNSSAPAVEGAIVAKESYGRQLGRISDALEAIISRLPDEEKASKPVADFLKMKSKIDHIKAESDRVNAERIVEDLLRLKERDRASFDACLKRIAMLAKEHSTNASS
jgi:hypothetical protein